MEKSRKDLAEYRLAKAKEHLKSAEYLSNLSPLFISTALSASKERLAFKAWSASVV